MQFKGIDSNRDYVRTKSGIPKRIFLCGGDIKNDEYFRLKINKELQKDKYDCTVILAEKALKSYEEQDSNADFLELETYFAALVSIIPIVCESPGSIAELGVFVGDIHIRDKVFIIIEKKYYSGKENDSFIRRGLINSYEKNVSKDKFKICQIDDRLPNKNVKRKDLESVAESIIKHPFKKTGCYFRLECFQILLVADIINALVVCSKKDIKSHFKYAMKWAIINPEELKQVYDDFDKRLNAMLFILNELDIIKKADKGHYMSMNNDCWFLEYRLKKPIKYKEIKEVRSAILNRLEKQILSGIVNEH